MYIPSPEELDAAIAYNHELSSHPDINKLLNTVAQSSVHARNHQVAATHLPNDDERTVHMLDALFIAGYAARDTIEANRTGTQVPPSQPDSSLN